MDLDLDDEQQALVDAVRAVLQTEWPPAALRSLVEGGGDAPEFWSALVDLDWPALTIDVELGGMGYGAVESVLVLEGCGRAVAPGPLFATTALFAPLIAALGSGEQQRRWLAGVASGTTTGTAGFVELRQRAGRPVVEAFEDAGEWVLRGTLRTVIEADQVDVIVVPAMFEQETAVFAIPRTATRTESIRSVDASRRLADVILDDVRVGSDAVLGIPGDPAVDRALDGAVDHAVTALAAELVGTCAAILETTIDHVKTREQFGVKIGSFQALKHRLADGFIELEAARSSVRVASVAIAENDPGRAVAASSAMALAADCARRITSDGIQLLGGVGFTWEHDVHFLVKRALGSSVLLGTSESHRQRVADLIGLVPA